MIALAISTTIITNVSASYRHLGEDWVPLVLRASCSTDRCDHPSGLNLSHGSYLRKIQALHDSIANQRYNYYRHLGEDCLPSTLAASCSTDRHDSLNSLTLVTISPCAIL